MSAGLNLPTIRRATPNELRAGLRLLWAELEPSERERRVAALLPQLERLPQSGLWVAVRGERLTGAVLAQDAGGKTWNVTQPALEAGELPQVAAALLAAVSEAATASGMVLIQSLLERDFGPKAERMRAAGFEHACDLLYLVSLAQAFPDAEPRGALEFARVTEIDLPRLARIVERTYRDSLDCPRIDARRSVEEVLAGYRANDPAGSAPWLLARQAGRDVGCLLLSDQPAEKQWELTYLGVVPEARGQGFGLLMTRQGQWLARAAGRERMVLAVDADNAPALDAYATAGFIGWDRRSVFARVLESRGAL